MEFDDTYYSELFFNLFNIPNEDEVEKVIQNYTELSKDENWQSLGGDEKMFGISTGKYLFSRHI